MSRRLSSSSALVAAAAVALAGLVLADRPGPEPGPHVDAPALRAALAHTDGPSRHLDDARAFFEARLAADVADPLALRRLASLELLAFRASGAAEELQAAADRVGALARRYPGEAGVEALAVSVALSRHDFAGAVRAAERARAAGRRGDEGPALRLFDAYMAVGRLAEARALLEGRSGPGGLAVLAREARLVDRLGDVEGAARRMRRVVRLADAYAQPAVVRAWARVEAATFTLHAGDPAGAVALHLEALDVLPGYAGALEGLGAVAYGVDGNLPAAEALLERALARGGHLDLLPLLAEIADARGNHERAHARRRDFVERATATPTSERLYRRPLALLFLEDPATRAAGAHLAAADVAARRDPMSLAVDARARLLAGDVAGAGTRVEEALAHGQPAPAVLALAGEILLESGTRRRGARLLREALEGRWELGPVRSAELRGLLSRERRAPPRRAG